MREHHPPKIPVIVKIEAQLDEAWCTWEEALELGEHGVRALLEEDLLEFVEWAGIEVIFTKNQ